jgi:hypothetical protein
MATILFTGPEGFSPTCYLFNPDNYAVVGAVGGYSALEAVSNTGRYSVNVGAVTGLILMEAWVGSYKLGDGLVNIAVAGGTYRLNDIALRSDVKIVENKVDIAVNQLPVSTGQLATAVELGKVPKVTRLTRHRNIVTGVIADVTLEETP